jgi:ribonuclease HI
MVAQLKLKLDSRCSNNQTEQLAIVKALEAIESLHDKSIYPCTATIFTDSRVILDATLTTMCTLSKRLERG